MPSLVPFFLFFVMGAVPEAGKSSPKIIPQRVRFVNTLCGFSSFTSYFLLFGRLPARGGEDDASLLIGAVDLQLHGLVAGQDLLLGVVVGVALAHRNDGVDGGDGVQEGLARRGIRAVVACLEDIAVQSPLEAVTLQHLLLGVGLGVSRKEHRGLAVVGADDHAVVVQLGVGGADGGEDGAVQITHLKGLVGGGHDDLALFGLDGVHHALEGLGIVLLIGEDDPLDGVCIQDHIRAADVILVGMSEYGVLQLGDSQVIQIGLQLILGGIGARVDEDIPLLGADEGGVALTHVDEVELDLTAADGSGGIVGESAENGVLTEEQPRNHRDQHDDRRGYALAV